MRLDLRRMDLPLDQTAAGRFLPWTIAALVYGAVLGLGIAAVADHALRLYHLRAQLVTVTLPPLESAGQRAQETAAALDMLQETRGVTSATLVPSAELEALLEPLLGEAESDGELPLPRLIDVTLDPLTKPDLAALERQLQKVAAGATIGVEALSRDRAERMATFFRAWGGGAGVTILLGALLAALLVTRVSLQTQTTVVELLRSMGAPDAYLARQFERYALSCGLRGGLLGFALAALTIAGLLYSSRQMELAGSIELNLRLVDWFLLACVPVVCALLVTAVARMTAMRSLAQMP
jgi:cell division transport system permease protein